MTAKYKNIMELAAAFKSGELSKDQWFLMLDNDYSSLRFKGPNPNEEGSDAHEEFEEAMNDKGHELFHGNGYSDLKDACEAAGIPAEWC